MKRFTPGNHTMEETPEGRYVLASDALALQEKAETLIQANGKLLKREAAAHLELHEAYEMIAKLAAKLTGS